MKVHKVKMSEFVRAVNHENPAMRQVETLCGTEPTVIAAKWSRVTCARCLKKRPKNTQARIKSK